jgi:hypothetical protein
MSTTDNTYKVSQEYEIIPHQKGQAYPISVKEWDYIKGKVKNINIEINIFYTIGFLLIGSSISCIITIFATDFKDDVSKYTTWSILGITAVCGGLSVYFGRDKHKTEMAKPTEVIAQMDLIESRFGTIDHT